MGEAARVEIGFADRPVIGVKTPATRNWVRFANSGASTDAWWQEAAVSEREILADVQRERSMVPFLLRGWHMGRANPGQSRARSLKPKEIF